MSEDDIPDGVLASYSDIVDNFKAELIKRDKDYQVSVSEGGIKHSKMFSCRLTAFDFFKELVEFRLNGQMG